MSTHQFPNLFSPIDVGSITLRNRIVFPPVGTRLQEDVARGSYRRMADFYTERARGGAGLITVSELPSHPTGFTGRYMTVLDETHVPHLRELTNRIKAEGAHVFQMIHHVGRMNNPFVSQREAWAPSAMRGVAREVPHEVDEDEIAELISSYARMAEVLQDGGFDGIELQGAHGFLLASFLSPQSNHRTDRYGGDLENRMRIVLEVIEAIRERCGREFVLGTTLSGDELTADGITVEMAKEIAVALERDGGLDYISVRIGDARTVPIWIGDMSVPKGMAVPLASGVRAVLQRLPVITTLKIDSPEQAEKILVEGHADMVSMGRALVADPELPRKALAGDIEDIRGCIHCNQGCLNRISNGLNLECAVNPAAGYEARFGLQVRGRAERRKRIVVIGAGPAGMAAAEVAAERGHAVTLIERDADLGGQLRLAGLAPNRHEVAEALRYLVGRMARLQIDIRMRQEASVESVLALKPDAIVVATGSTPKLPALPEPGPHGPQIWLVEQILNGEQLPEAPVIVLDGGNSHNKLIGITEFIIAQGRPVELVTPLAVAGVDVPPTSIPLHYRRIFAGGAEITTFHVLDGFEDGVVRLRNVLSDELSRREGVGAIVVAAPNRVNDELVAALKKAGPELRVVGDCVAPRLFELAIREGFEAAITL